MYVIDIIWLPEIVDKLAWKHGVAAEEVDQVLFGESQFRRVQKGNYPGEDVYAAYGQTHSGRYLIVFFVYKTTREALIISAREMEPKERRLYERR
jgi:uncharacterized DUF497 family protein